MITIENIARMFQFWSLRIVSVLEYFWKNSANPFIPKVVIKSVNEVGFT